MTRNLRAFALAASALLGSGAALGAEQFAIAEEARANPAFAEAWYNLADLLDDQGRSEAAVDCLRKALVVSPDYIDAMFQSGAVAAAERRVCRSHRLLAPVLGK
jgi:tetratricopeptide (TPR) repeat protein